MRAGSRTAYVLKQRLVAESEVQSRNQAARCSKTYVVAAATVSGIGIPKDGYERVIDGFEPSKTTVCFGLEDRADVQFSNEFAAETIDTAEFVRRMQDEAWVMANPHHPIAYMYHALRSYTELVKAIREQKPLMLFQRGKSKAFCVVGGDKDRNRFILERAKFSNDEINEILAKIS